MQNCFKGLHSHGENQLSIPSPSQGSKSSQRLDEFLFTITLEFLPFLGFYKIFTFYPVSCIFFFFWESTVNPRLDSKLQLKSKSSENKGNLMQYASSSKCSEFVIVLNVITVFRLAALHK